MFGYIVALVVITTFAVTQVNGKPIETKEDSASPLDSVNASVIRYLTRFGYLEESSRDVYSEDDISKALLGFQKFFGITATGQINDETIKKMKAPRCGVSDKPKFNIKGTKWQKRHITYTFQNMTEQLPKESVIKNVEAAFKPWAEAGNLVFSHVDDISQTDIVISFEKRKHADRYAFDGPGNTLAHAFTPGSGFGGDLHFDDDEIYLIQQTEGEMGIDLFTVAVHELGHSMGISHSTVPESIMYPIYKGWEPQDTFRLDYDDILAMYELYLKNPPQE